MTETLWGTRTKQRSRRRKRNTAAHTSTIPYSITGGDDCLILGHAPNRFDLAGCTTCIDCGARIFCPQCTTRHPQDEKAIPVLCERHEQESEGRHALQ